MSPIFQLRKDDKRMCVYSQRDFDYMTKIKKWEPVIDPVPVEVEQPPAPEVTKKRGRPSKAH